MAAEDTPQAVSFDSILPPFPPSFPTIRVQGTSHLLCFANLGKALHSLKCLKNLRSKVSANTGERNEVEKGQHRSVGSCLDKPSFPREAFELGGGGQEGGRRVVAWSVASIMQQKAEHSRKNKEKTLRCAAQSGQVGQAGLRLQSQKSMSEPCLAFPLLSRLEDSNPLGKAVAQPLARSSQSPEAART